MPTTELPAANARLLETVAPRHARPVVDARIEYAHAGTPLEGYLAEPEGGSTRAVLVFHAWMGVGANVEMRAQMLARLGYTAFAADVYGAGVRPTEFPEMRAEAEKYYDDLDLMRGRAQAGFDVLTARGFAPEDIVVIGYCFGATVAIEHARSGQASAGVAAFHARLIVHEPSDAGAIAAPLLVLTGAEDEVVPDTDLTAFMDELRGGPELDRQVSVYAGAPHAFTVPGPMYRAAADARSWREFLGFLDEFAPVG